MKMPSLHKSGRAGGRGQSTYVCVFPCSPSPLFPRFSFGFSNKARHCTAGGVSAFRFAQRV